MASLTTRKGSGNFYAVFRYNGKQRVRNLGVKIRGTPPAKLSESGDPEFERSRGQALTALQKMMRDIEDQRGGERSAQAIHELRTGRKIEAVTIDQLTKKFLDAPRKKQLSQQVSERYKSTINDFVAWIQKNYKQVHNIHEITVNMAQAYMKSIEPQVAPATYNAKLTALRAAFDKVARESGLTYNPFNHNDVPSKEGETISRKPYTVEQLQDIFAAAENYPDIKPLIITALSTAMRLGDCAQLKWQDVDLEEGFITVKTSKTGETVDIPLFPKLENELMQRCDNDSDFVFPDLAEQYRRNKDTLTRKLRQILIDAGFQDTRRNGTKDKIKPLNDDEIRTEAEKLRKTLSSTGKTDRMINVFQVYAAGNDINATSSKTGVSKGSVSGYLNECERILERPIIRGKTRKPPAKYGNVVQQRDGQQAASIYGWHSFRTTFISLALTSGIPLEIVKRITGHKTADIVLKHYLRPERQQIKQALQEKMPDLLTAGNMPRSQESEIIELVENLNSDNVEETRTRLLELLRKGNLKAIESL